jgi:membrane protease YdiL (CAAX protease family)
MHISGQPLLVYEARRPVPWNFLAPLAAVAFNLPLVALALGSEGPKSAAELKALAPGDLWAQFGAYMLMIPTCLVALAAVFRASPVDLGLPQSWAQLRQDARIGAVAFLAIVAPVHLLNVLLMLLAESDQGHPLISELETNHTPAMMLAALALAAVGAPLMEEIVFRSILQGWLERCEDRALARRNRTEEPPADFDNVPLLHEPPVGDEGVDSAVDAAAIDAKVAANVAPAPPRGGALSVLRYGWAPILASAALFAVAHLGHGVAPASLFPLGVALGYVYQRTHRLAPSIVCHALFNALSILVLWLVVAGRTS